MPGALRQQVSQLMTVRGGHRAQHTGPCLGVWVLFLILSSSSLAFASRPYLDHAAYSQQQQQHKGAQHIQQLTQQVASSINSLNRQLKQSARCPEGCDINGATSYCQQDSTSGALRCVKCLNNLIVNKEDGTCMCPPGKYSDGSASCLDCPKGSWCAGGKYSLADPPKKVQCPDFMTTLGLRSTSVRSCVNLPGSFYSMTAGVPAATICPENTYGPGLKKQRACVPCPTGYTTNGATGSRVVAACVVPPGYYLKGPGQVAPCPQGEWKSGIGADGNCTRCAMGVTTEGPAATSKLNCTILVPGFYAKAMTGQVVTEVAICPQKYYCSGGRPVGPFDPLKPTWLSPTDPTVKACPDGTWTQFMGSKSQQQCLTPPGFKTVNGATVQCGDNEYRADWKLATEATTCQSCGTGVKMLKSDRIVVYDQITYSNETQIEVATSSDDCYIQAGQGLLFQSIDKTWKAVDCNKDNYGVTNETFGLTPAPCRMCPQDMITSTDKTNYPRSSRWYVKNADGTSGFVSPYACVTKAGWGYNGRNSYKCDKGYYNNKDTYSECKPCKFGLTTAGLGLGVKESDCGIAPGYGYGFTAYYNSSIVECPIGTYNDKIQYDRKTPCTACPTGTTNTVARGDSVDDCDKCLPGWGGPKCAKQCGGVGEEASYGPPGREYGSPCISCNNVLTMYSYNWMTNNDVWSAPVTARIGAENAVDCLAEFTQLQDGAYYLPAIDVPGNVVTTNITTFSDCVALCGAGCSVVTYDYKTLECYTLTLRPSTYDGDPYVAFKNFQAGSTQASSVANKNTTNTTRAMNTDYGNYGWVRTPDALQVGIQVAAPKASTFTRYQQCMEACDYDRRCAGLTVQQKVPDASGDNGVTNVLGPKTCKLVYANDRPGTNKRSVVRVDTTSTAIPSYTWVCREMPKDVVHGKWPLDCAGQPPGYICQALCDCSPEECYSRDGCPTTICQADGNWGPFSPPECTLAIPADVQAISCPAPLRPGLWYDPINTQPTPPGFSCANSDANGNQSGRRLQSAAHSGAAMLMAGSKALLQPLAGGRKRGLLAGVDDYMPLPPWSWANGSQHEITPHWSSVTSVCYDSTDEANKDQLPGYNRLVRTGYGCWGFGQMMYDSGVCSQKGKSWFTGVAAQDFMMPYFQFADRRKWERLPKEKYESYVWSKFTIDDQPDNTTAVLLQGMQLVVVGTVGTDHPCQAQCSITAVELEFYELDANGAPKLTTKLLDPKNDPTGASGTKDEPWYHVKVNLPLNPDRTFQWNGNETGILNFDLREDALAVWFLDASDYWVRIKLHAPFNGTDDSGWARCYAHVGLVESPSILALWQEAGGYNTTCGPQDLASFPDLGQTVNTCTNNGGINSTIPAFQTCSSVTSTNTCAARKYGPDTPRSCPFGGQDILFSLYGTADNWNGFAPNPGADEETNPFGK